MWLNLVDGLLALARGLELGLDLGEALALHQGFRLSQKVAQEKLEREKKTGSMKEIEIHFAGEEKKLSISLPLSVRLEGKIEPIVRPFKNSRQGNNQKLKDSLRSRKRERRG